MSRFFPIQNQVYSIKCELFDGLNCFWREVLESDQEGMMIKLQRELRGRTLALGTRVLDAVHRESDEHEHERDEEVGVQRLAKKVVGRERQVQIGRLYMETTQTIVNEPPRSRTLRGGGSGRSSKIIHEP